MIFSFLKRHFIIPSFHPALLATVALIIGISFAHQGLSIITAVNIGFLTLIACTFLPEEQHATIRTFLLIILAFFGIGILAYAWQKNSYTYLYALDSKKKYSIKACISNYELIDQPYFKHRLTVYIKSIKEEGGDNWHTYSQHSIYLYLNHRPSYEIDDEIEISNIVFKQPTHESYAHYLIKEKISASCYIAPQNAFQLINHPSFSVCRFINTLKENMYFQIKQILNKDTFNLFSSLFLGKQIKNDSLTTYHNATSFKHWGLSHYLARSGLHVVIIVIIWHYLLNLLPLSFGLKQLFLILLVGVYSLLSWPTISFYRAIIMFIWYKLCLSLRLPSDYLYIIAAVTCCTLVYNPFALFFVDFQLSFGLTFALAWFSYINRLKIIAP